MIGLVGFVFLHACGVAVSWQYLVAATVSCSSYSPCSHTHCFCIVYNKMCLLFHGSKVSSIVVYKFIDRAVYLKGSGTVCWLLHWAWRFIQVSNSFCSHQAAACTCLVRCPAHSRHSWCGATRASPMSYQPLAGSGTQWHFNQTCSWP